VHAEDEDDLTGHVVILSGVPVCPAERAASVEESALLLDRRQILAVLPQPDADLPLRGVGHEFPQLIVRPALPEPFDHALHYRALRESCGEMLEREAGG